MCQRPPSTSRRCGEVQRRRSAVFMEDVPAGMECFQTSGLTRRTRARSSRQKKAMVSAGNPVGMPTSSGKTRGELKLEDTRDGRIRACFRQPENRQCQHRHHVNQTLP